MAGLSKRKYDIQFYVKVVEKFVQTGECAKTLYGETEDPLLLYLLAIMNDPSIRVLVLGDEVRARIFYDITTQLAVSGTREISDAKSTIRTWRNGKCPELD